MTKENHQPLVINIGFAKQISKTSLISSYFIMSSLYYLLMWHGPVARAILEHKEKCEYWGTTLKWKRIHWKIGDNKYWWNIPVKTSTKLPHNTHLEQKKTKTYSVIEISHLTDITMKNKWKIIKIWTSIKKPADDVQLLQIKNDNHYCLCFWHCSQNFKTTLGNWNFDKKEAERLIRKLQTIIVSRAVKIDKTFIKLKMINGPNSNHVSGIRALTCT